MQTDSAATADAGTVLINGGHGGYSPGLWLERRCNSPKSIQMIGRRPDQLTPLLQVGHMVAGGARGVALGVRELQQLVDIVSRVTKVALRLLCRSKDFPEADS